MTIQIPNPGTGNGNTGDNEFVMWEKVKNNFSNQDHAASRLVGTGAGQIPLAIKARLAASTPDVSRETVTDVDNLVGTDMTLVINGTPNAPTSVSGSSAQFVEPLHIEGTDRVWQFAYASHSPEIQMRMRVLSRTGFSAWAKILHTQNTTTDANGFVKAASPIVKVFANKVELNDDATSQDVTFIKNGIGDYTITTQSGLSTDGWYIELPKDLNGNPKVAVTLTETDGVISLKCYKRVFSMTTFTFEPDLDEPMDVPDGRWIDLRLNEILSDDTNPDEV